MNCTRTKLALFHTPIYIMHHFILLLFDIVEGEFEQLDASKLRELSRHVVIVSLFGMETLERKTKCPNIRRRSFLKTLRSECANHRHLIWYETTAMLRSTTQGPWHVIGQSDEDDDRAVRWIRAEWFFCLHGIFNLICHFSWQICFSYA